jgi:hypothetical protein
VSYLLSQKLSGTYVLFSVENLPRKLVKKYHEANELGPIPKIASLIEHQRKTPDANTRCLYMYKILWRGKDEHETLETCKLFFTM